MRAAYIRKLGGPEVLEIGELPTPVCADSEVLVRLKFSALNHLDIWIRKGLPSVKIQFPRILGADGAGVVESVGSKVTQFKKGDDVIVFPGMSCRHCEACRSGWETLCPEYKILGEHTDGTNAEFVKIPAVNAFLKPKTLSFENAAAFSLVFITAWQMVVRRAQVKKGERVLVHAAGSGVSSAAIQIAKLFGAEVIATSSTPEKLQFAKKLGADHLINYRNEDFLTKVKELTGKKGVEVIIDHVGKEFWEKNLRAASWGGRIVLCGATTGAEVTTNLLHVFYRQLQILGSTMGTIDDFPTILEHVANGKLKPVVDKVFPLAEIQQAHRYLEKGQQFGKVLLSLTQQKSGS